MIKGSNMIVCVLLVSNARGCCLAAPGNHEFDTNNTHTIMFDPDYNMIPPFAHSNQYYAHWRQFKVWIESNHSLRCHVTTLTWWQVSQLPPPPVTKCACQFLRETECVKSSCARPAPSAFRGDNKVDHAVCLKAGFHMHTVISNENGKFCTTMIYPCFSRLVCFSMGSPAWWRYGLCSSGSSLVSRWRDAPLVREFQMWRHWCKQIDLYRFQGRQMCF